MEVEMMHPSPVNPLEAEAVKRLRNESGVGMMDCKRCLEDFGWDYEKAKLHIRDSRYCGYHVMDDCHRSDE